MGCSYDREEGVIRRHQHRGAEKVRRIEQGSRTLEEGEGERMGREGRGGGK